MSLAIQSGSQFQTQATGAEVPLAERTGKTEEAKRTDACRQFEGMLLRQILSEARKPLLDTKSGGGVSSSIYRDMVTDQLSDSMSKAGGLGLAKALEVQLAPRVSTGSAGADSQTVAGGNKT